MTFDVQTHLPSPVELERRRLQYGRAAVVTSDRRLAALVRHGHHCQAYSSLQLHMRYLVLDGGYIAFAIAGTYALVLGDPIGPRSQFPSMWRALLAYAAERGVATIVVQASQDAADALVSLGCERHFLGVETRVELAGFQLSGGAMAYLRRACHRARKAGLTIREARAREVGLADKQRVSEAWLATKGGRELGFMIRPFALEDELDVRVFYGFVGDRMVGFVTFDPMYRDGRIIGYYQQHMRYEPGAPTGTIDAITIAAMDVFRQQGIAWVELGLSPFARHEQYARSGTDPVFAKIASRFYQKGESRYPFRGAYFHKSRYRGRERPVFLVENGMSRTGSIGLLGEITGVHRGAGILSWK